MRRAVLLLLGVIVALTLLGLGATWLARQRDAANHAGCRNNLRTLALLSTPFTMSDGVAVVPKDAPPAESVWPGTIVNAALPPDERLSWVVLASPQWDPKATTGVDRKQDWKSPPNREASQRVLRTLICPGFVPPLSAGEPAPTMYVGLAGLGLDAATLPLTEPLSKRAGAFRYDAPTPLEVIRNHDGLSQTMLYGQTVRDLGPWIRGGPSTVRGFDDAENARPILALQNGQFGGAFVDGSFFAFADGSVRLFRYSIDPRILKNLVAFASGPLDSD